MTTRPIWEHTEVIGLDTLSQQTYWLYHHAADAHRRVLWVVENDDKAVACAQLLQFWARVEGHVLPSITTFTNRDLETKHLDRAHLETLYALLKKSPGWVIVALDALEAVLPTSEELVAALTRLSVGAAQSPSDLVTRLVSLGYETDSSVASIGALHRSGGTVRVFSPRWEHPVRVEFDGNVVENLHSFDPKTGKSLKELSEVELFPNELSGRSFYRRTKLLDYIKNADAAILPNIHETMSPPEDAESTLKIFERLPHLTLTIFGALSENPLRVEFAKPPFYNHRLQEFQEDLKQWTRERRELIVGYKSDRIPDLFSHLKNPPRVRLIPDVPDELESFMDRENRRIIFAEEDILGAEPRVRPNGPGGGLEFLSELSTGDFVVHLDHGIGRFQGMSKTTVEGISKEYFVLLYDEGDKLFVPVEAADKITKYIGNPNPKLHRLHGASWHQITQQARKSTLKAAKELLALYAKRELARAPAMTSGTDTERKLSTSFTYEETPDQQRTIDEVLTDLESERPMDRLVCGDVGFGKTEVAIRAAMRAVQNGYQVAVLSPTTILTQQHFDTFSDRLKAFNARIGILSRFETPKEQQQTIEDTKNGKIDILVGTHRILSDDIEFTNLGLVIIDEEQRFGVKHKEKLKNLRDNTHILTLTATPIPRTLHFALSGLRSISSIETPPPGRLPIQNFIKPYDDDLVKGAIEREVARNGQVYYLYNRVETIGVKKQYLEKLVPNVRFAIAHGQMSEKELMEVMRAFDHHEVDVLVCSTIVENGIDLPNVNTMIVDNATLLGLSELYQLRGRVGRSGHQAYAYFLFSSQKLTPEARKRLVALKEAQELGSGLRLAQRDMEIRGTGSILGEEQHGSASTIGLTLYAKLLQQAVEELRTGKKPKPFRDIALDLPLEAAIPKHFEPREPRRLRMYQQLAAITSLKELAQWKKRLQNHAELPEKLVNLFEILEVRILCQETDILGIDTTHGMDDGGKREPKVVMKLLREVNAEMLSRLLELNDAWHFSETQLRIPLSKLGPNWLQQLKKTIRVLKVAKA